MSRGDNKRVRGWTSTTPPPSRRRELENDGVMERGERRRRQRSESVESVESGVSRLIDSIHSSRQSSEE